MSQENLENRMPWAYLDHNILSLFVNNPNHELKQYILERFQVVYSDETLKEIERSKGFEEKFLDVLESLDGVYLELQLTEKFRITDKVKWFRTSPRAVLKFKEENKETDLPGIVDSMSKFGLKMAGGLKGETFDSIFENQKESFSKLLVLINSLGQMDELKEIGIDFQTLTEGMRIQYKEVSEGLERSFKEQIPDQSNFRGPKEYREKINLGPRKLNNIKGPGVIWKIWEALSEVPEFKASGLTIDGFFGMDKNPIFPDEKQTVYGKVIGLYSILNSLGYYPDSNREKEDRFISSNSDSIHAAMGVFCNATFTMDDAFSKKIQAIYEFLEIGNAVHFCEQKKAV